MTPAEECKRLKYNALGHKIGMTILAKATNTHQSSKSANVDGGQESSTRSKCANIQVHLLWRLAQFESGFRVKNVREDNLHNKPGFVTMRLLSESTRRFLQRA